MKKKRNNLPVVREKITDDLSDPTAKMASPELVSLFQQAAKHLHNFAEVWSAIKQRGKKEGFTEKELQDMLRPYLRRIGRTKDQIYYLFHRDEQIERVKDNRKFTMDDVQKLNNRILEKDQEIARLESMVANLKISKKPTTGQINDLSILDEKIRKHEQDLVNLNKEVEPWVRTRVENVLQYARELEAKYKILYVGTFQ